MRYIAAIAAALLACGSALAGYVNFESSHVHPIALTPSGNRLLVVNTPDSLLEVFAVQPDGSLISEQAIPVGIEPVTVVARSEGEAWVVNNLSDSISIVDLGLGLVVKTVYVGDEPTDVAFAADRAFVAVSGEDRVKVYLLPGVIPLQDIELFSRDVRALAVSPDGTRVYAVAQRSGNQTTVVNGNVVYGLSLKPEGAPPDDEELHEGFYATFSDLFRPGCVGAPPPPPPPLPAGIVRNPALPDPADGVPKNSIIVRWSGGKWIDSAGSDWTHCVHLELPDKDLFIIDAASLSVDAVPHLGTTLFEVSVNPVSGRIYVPHTNARNFVRFEHPLGLRGHPVDNRLSVVDPSGGNAVTVIDLNAHIDRQSQPETNLAERLASVSQPGMIAWKSDGSVGWMTAIGSRKVFRIDGNCMSPGCIFGPDRANPNAVEVGLGPTGVALREAAAAGDERLYVLNRVSHSVVVVKTSTLEVQSEVALHDPSPASTRDGRKFLYDAIFASGHGDAACSSCHPSGDMDGLAWELGNPEASQVNYPQPLDNVKFVFVAGEDVPGISDEQCDPPNLVLCADHVAFDPQKGPMVTQTLRGLLEPLHWRGDRATFRDFNQTFVNLLGAKNQNPQGVKPAGMPSELMEAFRQFALGIRFPPNPNRNVDDTLPCKPRAVDPTCQVRAYGNSLWGNPTQGELLFTKEKVWAGDRNCTVCHNSSFGTFSGALGGVEPAEPVSPFVTRLHAGDHLTEFPGRHSDVEVPQLRNLYDKFGPAPLISPMIEVKGGFGYSHDGSIPDVLRWATTRLFDVHPDNSWSEIRDLAAFLFAFPTGTRPAVGRQVTLPAGAPPTGNPADEALLAKLASLGDLASPTRHCELWASTFADGRLRSYAWSAGVWLTDLEGEAPVSMQALRAGAAGPITFTCGTLDSGLRLGGDRDEDGVLNGNDCAPADASTLGQPLAVSGLTLTQGTSTVLAWEPQAAIVGPSVTYEVLGAALSDLLSEGIGATGCVATGIGSPTHSDSRPDPPPGDGYYYLVRAKNPCGVGDLGPGWESLDLACP